MSDTAILYDEECGFCRWSLARVLSWDRRLRLRPVALQSPEATALLRCMTPGERLASWHLVTPDGRVRSGGAAVAPLARLLPFASPVAALAEAFPAATERAYRWVASNRDTLARMLGSKACEVRRGRPPPS